MFDFFNGRLAEVYRAAGFTPPDRDALATHSDSPSPLGLLFDAAVGPSFAVSVGLPEIGENAAQKGLVGRDLDVESAARACELAALCALSRLQRRIGDLYRVDRVLFVQTFIASAEGFVQQPRVANGASRAMHAVFGERGRHARAALGVLSIPRGHAAEVTACFRLREAAEPSHPH